MSEEERELHITPLFVYNELRDHQKECSRRWWAVMCLAVSNLAGVIAILLTHGH